MSSRVEVPPTKSSRHFATNANADALCKDQSAITDSVLEILERLPSVSNPLGVFSIIVISIFGNENHLRGKYANIIILEIVSCTPNAKICRAAFYLDTGSTPNFPGLGPVFRAHHGSEIT